MASRSRSPSLFAQWSNLVIDAADLCVTAQEVVARRFWMLGTQSHRRPRTSIRELNMIGSEKVRATFDSASAMGFAAMGAAMNFFAGLALPPSTPRSTGDAAHAGVKILRSGMVPVRKKVRANAARLRRK